MTAAADGPAADGPAGPADGAGSADGARSADGTGSADPSRSANGPVAAGARRPADDAPPSDDRIREAIDALLDARRAGATICPSDAARALRPDGDWRALMDDVRRVAADETEAGRLEVRQKGQRVDPATARGPIRLARP